MNRKVDGRGSRQNICYSLSQKFCYSFHASVDSGGIDVSFLTSLFQVVLQVAEQY